MCVCVCVYVCACVCVCVCVHVYVCICVHMCGACVCVNGSKGTNVYAARSFAFCVYRDAYVLVVQMAFWQSESNQGYSH